MSSKSRASASSSSQVWAILLVSLLLLGTVVLVVAAIDHAQPRTAVPELVERLPPTTTPQPTTTEESTPTPTPAPLEQVPRAAERFLMVDSSGVMWRAVAGSCATGEPPLLERSADGGVSWSDVTPRYLGITQIAGLIPFTAGQAQLVGTLGADCTAQGLRTYTQGSFWEVSPDVLSGASYLPPAEPAAVVSAIGVPTAPCSEPASLFVTDAGAALICDGRPYVWTRSGGPTWTEVPAGPSRAVLLSGGTFTLAGASADCAGVGISTTSAPEPSSFQTSCKPEVDPVSAIALASTANGPVMWVGDTVQPAY